MNFLLCYHFLLLNKQFSPKMHVFMTKRISSDEYEYTHLHSQISFIKTNKLHSEKIFVCQSFQEKILVSFININLIRLVASYDSKFLQLLHSSEIGSSIFFIPIRISHWSWFIIRQSLAQNKRIKLYFKRLLSRIMFFGIN